MSTRKTKKFSADIFADSLSSFGKKLSDLPNFIYYLVPFVVLSVWLITLVLTDKIVAPQTYYLLQYVFTYDHGFVPRGLFGEILSWFVDTITDEIVVKAIIGLDALLVVSASLCIGKLLTKTKNDPYAFSVVGFLCIFSCFLPLSYGDFFVDVKLDKILWILTLFAVYLSDRKYLIWLVPVLCIIATLINPVFLFTSMLVIAIILLYKYFSSKFSVKNLIICIVSYVSMIALGIAGIIGQKNLGFANAEELVLFYFSKYDKPLRQDVIDRFGTNWIFDYFGNWQDNAKHALEIYFPEMYGGPATISCLLFIAIPTFAFLTWLWVKAIKTEPDKFRKFIYFLCILIPVVIIPVSVISWEFAKYFAHTVLVEFCLIIYFFTRELPGFKAVIKQITDFLKEKPLITILLVTYIFAFI